MGLEGVVAKRVDAAYTPGRRSSAAVKFKHWRREHALNVTGWRPAEGDRPEAFFLRYDDGRYAGEARFGLGRDDREVLRARARAASARARRGQARTVALGAVRVDVDHHGRLGGRLRDPVIRAICP